MPTPGPAPSSMLAFMAAVVVTDTLPADLRNPLAKIYRDNSEGRGFSRLRDDQAPQTQPVTFLAFQATDNGCRWAIPRATAPAPRPGARAAATEARTIAPADLAAAADMFDNLTAGTFYARQDAAVRALGGRPTYLGADRA
jgi:hypothetical protein